jgi:hypothetical protein
MCNGICGDALSVTAGNIREGSLALQNLEMIVFGNGRRRAVADGDKNAR